MKRMCSRLAALVFFVVYAAAAFAQSGTPWEKQIDGKGRFRVLSDFDGAAVFDNETALVWERSPAITLVWIAAQMHCNRLNTGGRLGWRLPTLQELASLVDPSVPPPGPALPAGHPFQNVQSFFPYWSATTFSGSTGDAWVVNFSNSGVLNVGKSSALFVWCVRGGQGVDPQ